MAARPRVYLDDVRRLLLAATSIEDIAARLGVQADSVTRAIERSGDEQLRRLVRAQTDAANELKIQKMTAGRAAQRRGPT